MSPNDKRVPDFAGNYYIRRQQERAADTRYALQLLAKFKIWFK